MISFTNIVFLQKCWLPLLFSFYIFDTFDQSSNKIGYLDIIKSENTIIKKIIYIIKHLKRNNLNNVFVSSF